MKKIQFRPGKPACPVSCKYCFITEHDTRREVWNSNPIAGINKACTYINVPPWIGEDRQTRERFETFPWEILKGDFVGFTAITDPFWPRIDTWLKLFLKKVSPVAKIVTCVSKWLLSREQMEMVSQYPNFFWLSGSRGIILLLSKCRCVSIWKRLRWLASMACGPCRSLILISPEFLTCLSCRNFAISGITRFRSKACATATPGCPLGCPNLLRSIISDGKMRKFYLRTAGARK